MATLDPALLTPKQQHFIQLLQQFAPVSSLRQLCRDQGLDFNFAKGFLLSGLLDPWVRLEAQPSEIWEITPQGQRLQGHLPGDRLGQLLRQGFTTVADLQEQLGSDFSGEYGALHQAQGVTLVTDDHGIASLKITQPPVLEDLNRCQALFAALQADPSPTDQLDPEPLRWLQDQGWISLDRDLDYSLHPLPPLQTLELSLGVTTLTSDLLLSQGWRSVQFKPYNIQDAVPNIPHGRPSILGECIQRIRTLFLTMGFDEMAGTIVESAFWNFDALFTPQDHPAREVQDTFYLADPAALPLPADETLVQRVQQVHEHHYDGPWWPGEASRALLRAHTTPFTARQLYKTQGQPGKYFSIDKVFRNENVDRTHLAEFHQIEGVVIGELLSIRSLMGYLGYFYEQLGFQDLKFKPTYNPYTEPSLEVYAYHAPSDSYLEVGNSGMFRREMLEPLGCGEVSAIAWGLGLERIALLLYGVDRLSDLIGADSRI
ncbi:phenylalanine--tRNA ligase subunit alpha [Prochlorothrix hollandica]|uniref:phenylalanine--tRNA ligase subunit alpha n=1 Tax=Prochlorothrix hollandica TaxID=1223 RepID=UPI003341620D